VEVEKALDELLDSSIEFEQAFDAAEQDRYRAAVIRNKARREGWHPSDLSWYSIEALEALTEAVLGGFVPMPPPDKVRGGDPAEGGNVHAALADVSKGIYKLIAAEHRATLMFHHAGVYEATPEALQDAYEALRDVLGGTRPGAL
jgi:hypothetical protein